MLRNNNVVVGLRKLVIAFSCFFLKKHFKQVTTNKQINFRDFQYCITVVGVFIFIQKNFFEFFWLNGKAKYISFGTKCYGINTLMEVLTRFTWTVNNNW